MRLAILLALLPLPVFAWEFSPSPICTIRHEGENVAVEVTYDDSLPEYAIHLTLAEGRWPDAPAFAIAFGTAPPLTIQTDRHSLSADGRTLSVRDRGFGNVLNGLEFASRALAISGERSVELPLTGAAEAVARFRDCPAPSLS